MISNVIRLAAILDPHFRLGKKGVSSPKLFVKVHACQNTDVRSEYSHLL